MTTDDLNALYNGYCTRVAHIRAIDPASVIPSNERSRASIKTVGTGGVLRFNRKTFLVTGIARYDELQEKGNRKTGYFWFELTLVDLASGLTSFLEWEKDDTIECYLTERTLSWRDLKDDEGAAVDEDDLEQISDDEDSLRFGTSTYEYDDDCPAVFVRVSGEGRQKKGGEKVWLYDFTGPNDSCITIEEWEESKNNWSYEIYLSRKLAPSAIEIISLGERIAP